MSTKQVFSGIKGTRDCKLHLVPKVLYALYLIRSYYYLGTNQSVKTPQVFGPKYKKRVYNKTLGTSIIPMFPSNFKTKKLQTKHVFWGYILYILARDNLPQHYNNNNCCYAARVQCRARESGARECHVMSSFG